MPKPQSTSKPLGVSAGAANPPEYEAMEKAIKFIEMAVKKRKMLRYRAWGSKEKRDED